MLFAPGCLSAPLLALWASAAFVTDLEAAETGDALLTTSVVRSTGVNAGLCVLLGFEDAAMATRLSKEGSFLVHCLYSDRQIVEEARAAIRSAGIYGRVSADHGSFRRLPYAENLVNLIVADNFSTLLNQGLTVEELLRVLCPNGVAYLRDRAASKDTDEAWLAELKAQTGAAGAGKPEVVREAGTWVKIVKPRPANIDEWTHSLHGPDGNAVADDEVVGPPRRLQWVEKPLWQRHHDTVPSVTAMVSSGGRLFYINNEAPIGIYGMPDQWFLTARDAFNGLLLWKRPIPHWGWKAWGDRPVSRNQPLDIARRLVAVADRVYVTLGFNAPLTALDAATGEILATYPGTDFTDEVLYHEGTLILSVNEAAQKPGRAIDNPPEKKSVLAINAGTGQLLWKKGSFLGVSSRGDIGERITHLTPVVGGQGVFLLEEDAVVALDLKTGEELWRAARLPKNNTVAYNIRFSNQCTLLYHDGVVLLAQQDYKEKTWPWAKPIESVLLAISARTGEALWTHQCGCWIRTGVFAID
ncbi:MAG: PQQ-binding-like beta-propeller repeat protein, partial [Planctomycetota bacterium]